MQTIVLDLHGVLHEDVIPITEEWMMMWSYRVPAFSGKIITGNSAKMKTLALSALKKHDFDYKLMGNGNILVTGNI